MTGRPGLAFAGMIASAAPVAAQTDDTLDIAAQFENQGAEASTTGYIFTRMGIAETLVGAGAQGRSTPGLATGRDVSEDGLTRHFDIRTGVTLHDGSPLTAEAVAGALEIARAKPAPPNGLAIERIAAEASAVVVALTDPLAAAPAFLAGIRSPILAQRRPVVEVGRGRGLVGRHPAPAALQGHRGPSVPRRCRRRAGIEPRHQPRRHRRGRPALPRRRGPAGPASVAGW